MKNLCKRAFDVSVASAMTPFALAVGVPVALTMAAVTLSNPIYSTKRVGKDGRKFKMYKIKTMSDDCDAARRPLRDELRTTRIGEMVRKSRMDELPQLWNVFKGDMAMVGPRPHLESDEIAHDELRQSVRPGLTDLGKIKGFNSITHRQELRYNRYYIKRSQRRTAFENAVCDTKIIAYTPIALWKNRSAAHSMQVAKLSA